MANNRKWFPCGSCKLVESGALTAEAGRSPAILRHLDCVLFATKTRLHDRLGRVTRQNRFVYAVNLLHGFANAKEVGGDFGSPALIRNRCLDNSWVMQNFVVRNPIMAKLICSAAIRSPGWLWQ
jgi:hypothetical protein